MQRIISFDTEVDLKMLQSSNIILAADIITSQFCNSYVLLYHYGFADQLIKGNPKHQKKGRKIAVQSQNLITKLIPFAGSDFSRF